MRTSAITHVRIEGKYHTFVDGKRAIVCPCEHIPPSIHRGTGSEHGAWAPPASAGAPRAWGHETRTTKRRGCKCNHYLFRWGLLWASIKQTWIPLIVEISTPKPKSINFAKFKRKRTPERLFPLQNAFFNSRTLPNGFERFLNAFWTLFSTPERPKCQERQKPLWCSFFHTNPQNRSSLGLVLKLQVSWFTRDKPKGPAFIIKRVHAFPLINSMRLPEARPICGSLLSRYVTASQP